MLKIHVNLEYFLEKKNTFTQELNFYSLKKRIMTLNRMSTFML